MQDFEISEKKANMRFKSYRKNTQKKYFFLSDKKNISIFSEKSWFREKYQKKFSYKLEFCFFSNIYFKPTKKWKTKQTLHTSKRWNSSKELTS